MANATEKACSLQDIIKQEFTILETLEWKVNLTNFSTWINETTINWDQFVDNIHLHSNEIRLNLNLIRNFKFRENNLQSLNLFRAFTQFIDIISFDIEYLLYFERILCLSVIYLLILKYFNMIDLSQIPYLKMDHVNNYYEFNLLFDRFLNKYYSLEFANIFDHIQYTSCYIESALHFEQINIEEIV